MTEDLIKRITFLQTKLSKKKTLVEKEMFEMEKICKELISLNDKLEKLNEQDTRVKP